MTARRRVVRVAWWAAAVLALAGSRAHAQPTTATVLPRTLDAYDAVARDGLLYVLEPDQRAVTAYTLPAIAVAWRRPLPDATTTASQLTALEPGRLLVWNSGRLYVLARATGALTVQHTTLGGGRAFLDQHGDACGLNTACGYQPIDCADARPLGDVVRGASTEFFDPEGASSGCYGFVHAPVGATSSVAAFVFAGTTSDARAAVTGIDRATGATRYRNAAVACEACSATGCGAIAALDLCWTVDTAHAIDVRAFACSTGAPRWAWHAAGDRTTPVVTSALAGGAPAVLVAMPGTASLLDARTGRIRWTRAVPADALATLAGARSNASLVHLYGYRSVVTLDATSGALGATTTQPGRHVAWQPGGTFRATDLEVPGETGGPTAPFPAHDPVIDVVRGPGDAPARVRVRGRDAPVLVLAHDGGWVGEAADGADVLAVVFAREPAATGHVRFVRVHGAPPAAR